MKEQLTHKEMSSRGGKAKWAKISKKQRSEIMRKVAKARYMAKNKDKKIVDNHIA